MSTVWSTEFKGCKYALGIDLGTTNSCVSLWRMDRQKAKVFKNFKGGKTFPSVVAFCGDDWSPVVGELVAAAREKGSVGRMTQTASDVKRVIGLDIEDDRVKEEQRFRPYRIVAAPELQHRVVQGTSKLQLQLTMGPASAPVQRGPRASSASGAADDAATSMPSVRDDESEGYFYPEELSARILQHAKRIAEEQVGEKINAAVVTIPAYFEHNQRKATRAAARLAGFEKVRLLTEPTAGAMAYGLFVAGKKTVCVFDLGGGTFDTSLLEIDEGKVEVLATHGNTRVGGADIDKMLVEHVLEEVQRRRREIRSQRTSSEPLPGKTNSLQLQDVARSLDLTRLRAECEAAKIALSTAEEATVSVYARPRCTSSYSGGPGVGQHQESKVDSATRKPISSDSSSSVPECSVTITREQLERVCSSLFDNCMRSIDDCLCEAGLTEANIDEVVLIGGCTRMPDLRRRLQSKFNRELCVGVDPDKAVAMGAAIQAAILTGADQELLKDILTLDVIPRSVGIEVKGGEYQVLIPRNSKIPCRFTKVFRTVIDQQPNLRVVIYEGENPIAQQNQKLIEMRIVIARDRRGPAGKEVEIGLALDENGIFHLICSEQELSEAEIAEQNRQFYFGCVALVCLIILYVYMKMHFHIPKVPVITTPFPEYHGEGVFGSPPVTTDDAPAEAAIAAETAGDFTNAEESLSGGSVDVATQEL